MSNFPKPPKLYFYITGLAIFILILGSGGFYFYQKLNSTTTQKPQNSLTSKEEEEVKTPDSSSTSVANPETQISSASFDADPNTDVIVFEECNVVLKLPNNPDLRFYITRSKNSSTLSVYLTTPSKFLHSLSCTTDKSDEIGNVANFLETPVWLKKLSEDYKLKLGGSTGNITWINNFHYNNFNYNLVSSYDDVFTSAKFGIGIPNSLKQVKVIDLMNLPTFEEYNKNPQKIIDVNFVGCGQIENFGRCYLADQDYRPIIDFNDQPFVDFNGRLYKGKRNAQGVFLVSENTIDWGSKIHQIYDFNFASGVKKIEPYITIANVGATDSIILQNEYYVDTKCAFNKSGVETKPCFKTESDYDDYISKYNYDLAKNKAAEAELAKYLE